MLSYIYDFILLGEVLTLIFNPFFALIPIIILVSIVLLVKNSESNKKGKIVITLIAILLLPVAIYEYFVFLWYWGGDGLFTLIAVPILYSLFMFIQSRIFKRYKENVLISTIGYFTKVLITPVLTVATLYLIAWIFKIDIIIA